MLRRATSTVAAIIPYQFVRFGWVVRSWRTPNVLHLDLPAARRLKRTCNIYTLHDLVLLRLPFTTLNNKRQTYRLLRKIAAEADHIVTVSEQTRYRERIAALYDRLA